MAPLRIFEEGDPPDAVVAIHGWLTEAELEELARVVAGKGPNLRIDLSQLMGADHGGLRALQKLREAGVPLTGASPFIQLLLI
jgi:hypothetical protein